MKTLYYSSLSLDEEITLAQFKAEGGVMAYKNNLNNIVKCELFLEKERTYVVYFSSWPSQDIIDEHVVSYPGCDFEINHKKQDSNGNDTYIRYICSPDGKLRHVIEELMNSNGDIVRENRLSEKLEFLGALEYEYDMDGEISLTREIAQNGDIISENE
jgi:hypothetical protein